ncbi:MAG: ATP-dependent Clp protease proteolytic subunit [Cellulomonas sp. 73-145]|uniref:ClpP family protease n=1 Tax=Cellulomonas sp. 73-145 TaxID=1895739 RepID=UPI0009277A72|nr:ATP-dependent Clp protease proteolytic subunit [Cellulomonas sp. 73-145]OJV58926.1 MAG: ATP-dependent Clp protease proteolytic subunit [Cellulomonas sp. 73-145]
MDETTYRPGVDDELTTRLLHRRILLLGSALDETLGNRLCSSLLLLAADDPDKDITLLISSPGGSVPAMLAIRDVMDLIPNDVATVGVGWAASAGQFLLSSGTKGKRSALRHSRILLHQGSAGIGGTAVDIEVQADDLRHMRDTVLGLVAADTGQPLERIREDSRRDRWFTAEEAREYGFVDGVVERLDQLLPGVTGPVGFGVRP